MEDGQILEVEVPRQIPSEEEAVAIEETGEASESSCLAVMGGNMVVNFILAASLNHLWSMINGLQIPTHMQLFSLKFPANASFLVRFLVSVATFDILPIEVIWFFFELPDRGSYIVNFASSGYEYMHVLENLGTSMFLIQVYITSCILMMIAKWLRHKSPHIEKYYLKSHKFLFWGAALRFIFEAYLEIGLAVIIGLVTM